MPTAKAGDVNIYYEVQGEGQPLVMIPGLGGDISLFKRTILPFLNDYRVIAIDNRGAGRSDKPDLPYSMEMMAGDVVSVLDALGIVRAHVLGFSMGGVIAQFFALKYPERLLCLILGCTSTQDSHAVGGEETKSLVNPVGREALTPEESARRMISMMYPQKFLDANPELSKELLVERLKATPDPVGFRRQLQAAAQGPGTYERLPEIEAPTLVIVGDEDKLVNPENSKILASRIPRSELAVIKGAGHGLGIMPETQTVMLDFLKRHRQVKLST